MFIAKENIPVFFSLNLPRRWRGLRKIAKQLCLTVNKTILYSVFVFLLPAIQSSSYALENFEFDLFTRGYIYTHQESKETKKEDYFLENKFDIIYQRKFLNDFWLRLNLRSEFDTPDIGKRKELDLRESFIEYRLKHFDCFIGKRIFNLGKADQFNPSDRLNPKDYTDFLDNTKIGVFSTGLKSSIGTKSTVELYLIPFPVKSRINVAKSRWAVLDSTAFTGIPIKEEAPAESIKNIQTVIRYCVFLNNFDFSLNYLRKFEDIPLLLTSTDAVLKKYFRENIFSTNASTTYGDLEIHGELAYYDDLKKTQAGSFSEYVLGINYSCQDPIFEKELKFVCEYLGGFDVRKPGIQLPILGAINLARLFEESFFLKVNVALTDFSQFTISNTQLRSKDFNSIIRLEYTYEPRDSFEIGLGTDLIWGDNNTIFQKFSGNDRLWVKMEYKF